MTTTMMERTIPDYEWVYNPTTLMWDWTYVPVITQPVVEQVQPVVTTIHAVST